MNGKKKTVFIFADVMGKIYLKNIRLYAFHGCMDEEEKIGSLEVNSHSMKHLIDEQKDIQTLLSKRWKHQVMPEGESDDDKLDHLPPLKLFDNLLNNFTTCITSV